MITTRPRCSRLVSERVMNLRANDKINCIHVPHRCQSVCVCVGGRCFCAVSARTNGHRVIHHLHHGLSTRRYQHESPLTTGRSCWGEQPTAFCWFILTDSNLTFLRHGGAEVQHSRKFWPFRVQFECCGCEYLSPPLAHRQLGLALFSVLQVWEEKSHFWL